MEERTRELTALLEVSRSINSTLALEPLLDLILDQLLRVIAYGGASIIVARDDLLETVASHTTRAAGTTPSQVGYTVPLTRAMAIWQAVLRGVPVVKLATAGTVLPAPHGLFLDGSGLSEQEACAVLTRCLDKHGALPAVGLSAADEELARLRVQLRRYQEDFTLAAGTRLAAR